MIPEVHYRSPNRLPKWTILSCLTISEVSRPLHPSFWTLGSFITLKSFMLHSSSVKRASNHSKHETIGSSLASIASTVSILLILWIEAWYWECWYQRWNKDYERRFSDIFWTIRVLWNRRVYENSVILRSRVK